ncbi:MAG: amidohydrolase family protein, partial [Candidatus Korarchaeota archaeon]|nr:amidohydrolase family protein [Candidatus Korarchaeota archaeon]
MRVRALVNGRIYSSFKPIRVHEAMVTAGKNIVYVGSSEKAERLASHMDGEVVDLEGRAVLPGFIDVHMHVDNLGLALSSLDLRGTGSIRELKERLRRYYEEHRGASWILGRGWDQELFEEKRWPTRWDLDEAVSDKPVLLVRICGHAAVANTKALELAGLLDNPPDDPNVRQDEEGRPTGLLVEDAIMQVRSRISFTDEELEAMVEKALWHAASLGVTTLGFVSCSPRVLSMLERIRLRLGRLPVRIRAYLSREAAEPLLELGVRRGFGNEYLKIMGVKLFTDGSLGARTAWLSEPYD